MESGNNYKKLIIFDLDGVLIDSREYHFEALNRALQQVDPQYVISKDEHLSTYDGLSTTKKLELLTKNKGLPKESYQRIWELKQEYTIILYEEKIKTSAKLIEIFRELRNSKRDYYIGVASNSIKKTMDIALKALGVRAMIDCVVSNEDVEKTKPYPAMYWKIMNATHAIPSTTIIIEDSHIGRQAAIDSGATLLPVENPDDLTLDKVLAMCDNLENKMNSGKNIPWRDSKLNVLIPMAGAGSRFQQAGYSFPKPLIDVRGKPMIQVVVENLNIEANFIYIVQKEHYDEYHLKYLLNLITPGCTIVQLDEITEGAAETVLTAKDHINNENPLLIVNSDQFIEWNSNEVMYAFSADQIDGGILTFKSTHPKWSYVKLDDRGFVSELAEKKVISDIATVGIYYWRFGEDFVWNAEEMMNHDDKRINGEWYVAPVFQEAIEDSDAKIRVKHIDKMWGLGTPEDLQYFLNNYKGKI